MRGPSHGSDDPARHDDPDVFIPVLARQDPNKVVRILGLEALLRVWSNFPSASGTGRLATILVTLGLASMLLLVVAVAAHSTAPGLILVAIPAFLIGLIAAVVGGVLALLANRNGW
jgi:hypothetical protein